ncbi:MAG: DUF1232 domain-containing protein [Acidobacteria bacterium]|nr:DUF1232 domain-containing protein [Acidobacteriota bacterium]
MADEKKNWLGPYIPEGSWLREILQQAKLAYYLMLDPRVNPLAKLIPVAAAAYLILPIEPTDVVPVLGQIDDVGIMLIGLRIFFELAPPEVVHEHLKRLARTVRGDWDVNDPSPPPPLAPTNDGDVVDGSFRKEE